jgi:hypothetical protein
MNCAPIVGPRAERGEFRTVISGSCRLTQWWQFRSTPMRSVILAKVSVLKIAWEAW